jgi:hypothetical protein
MRAIVIAALTVLAIVLLVGGESDFYNPPRGVPAAGRDETVDEPHERELLRMTLTTADVNRFGGAPTLRQITTFYGVQDSLPCTVERTFESNDITLADRPRPVGSVITVCLN